MPSSTAEVLAACWSRSEAPCLFTTTSSHIVLMVGASNLMSLMVRWEVNQSILQLLSKCYLKGWMAASCPQLGCRRTKRESGFTHITNSKVKMSTKLLTKANLDSKRSAKQFNFEVILGPKLFTKKKLTSQIISSTIPFNFRIFFFFFHLKKRKHFTCPDTSHDMEVGR